ncbi:MAG: NAD-dependent deacylase [Bacteroidetes bacterium]|nr:NAD-dependent deacylase [Bacteroidota bacterium]
MKEALNKKIREAASKIKEARHVTAFTGAGISVESGIPPFRGENGIWNKYDPMILDIHYFMEHPAESWQVIKEIFYDFFGKAEANRAHLVLAEMEKSGLLSEVITQNIDNLHQKAGSTVVHEFHGNSRNLICTKSGELLPADHADLDALPPIHPATGGLLKPDFIFFGEGIPPEAYQASIQAARNSDIFLVIGTTGEIMPASQIPFMAKENGAYIIEVNTEESNYTSRITDIFLQGKATEIMNLLAREMQIN